MPPKAKKNITKAKKPIVAAAAAPEAGSGQGDEEEQDPVQEQVDHHGYLVKNKEANACNAQIFGDLSAGHRDHQKP